MRVAYTALSIISPPTEHLAHTALHYTPKDLSADPSKAYVPPVGNDATCGLSKFSFYPQNRYPFVGFRCCQDAGP